MPHRIASAVAPVSGTYIPSAPTVKAAPPLQQGTSNIPACSGMYGSNFLAICNPCPTQPYSLYANQQPDGDIHSYPEHHAGSDLPE